MIAIVLWRLGLFDLSKRRAGLPAYRRGSWHGDRPCEMLDLEQLTKLLAGGCSFVYEMNYSFAYDMS
jgi:hypothetical protein